MAGFSNTFEDNILKLLFNATAISNIADNAASSPSTALWVSLHTADPADTGTQGTNETAYTGYARVAVARTTSGWAVTDGSGTVSPVSAITFGQATSTSTGTLTHAGIGLSSSSTSGIMIASGAISPNINYQQNTTPSLTTGSSFTLD